MTARRGVGGSHSSMRRSLAAAACALAVGCARGGEPQAERAPPAPHARVEATTAPRNCVLIELTPLKVVRIDEPQRRLFVVAADGQEGAIVARIRDLDACFNLTEWSGRWSLSVFTDAALARYKDDPKVAAAVSDGRWSRAYRVEYRA